MARLAAPPLRLTALAVLLAIAAIGCGAQKTAISHDAGARLARQSDTVASLLARGDGCGALRAAVSLRRSAAAAISAGEVSTARARELRDRTASLASSIACTPPPAPPPPPVFTNNGGGEEGD